MKTKADKLISRGSETPEVAATAEAVAEMVIRMRLGQALYFAEAAERAVPGMTKQEADSLSVFFSGVASYFAKRANGELRPDINLRLPVVRNWETGDGCYNLLRVFAVLACPFDFCPDKPDCWETRRAFCKMDGDT
jgi:hypothetical protein